MKSTFYVDLNMKTAKDFENYGRFFIGHDQNSASNIFAALKGTEVIREALVLPAA